MPFWISLITSLPAENATVRMRAWRTLKAAGAAVLRDGVYLLPEQDDCRQTFESVAEEILAANGTALVLRVEEPAGVDFCSLFDRSGEYAELLSTVTALHAALNIDTVADTLKQVRKLRRTFITLSGIDYFAGEAQKQVEEALHELEQKAARVLSPDEPHSTDHTIPRLAVTHYRGRIWATRRRPWVDRLACAWLIRRFIDPNAQILWLASPADCPSDALGFDFDGATFTHVGARVSFEVLLASFGLETPALQRLASVVHFLDAGGVQPPEAIGVESVLAGLRDSILDDDTLLVMAEKILDGLLVTYEKGVQS